MFFFFILSGCFSAFTQRFEPRLLRKRLRHYSLYALPALYALAVSLYTDVTGITQSSYSSPFKVLIFSFVCFVNFSAIAIDVECISKLIKQWIVRFSFLMAMVSFVQLGASAFNIYLFGLAGDGTPNNVSVLGLSLARVNGFFEDPNFFAIFQLLAVSCIFELKKSSVKLKMCLVVVLFSIFLTHSRGALLALIGIYLAKSTKTHKLRKYVVAFLLFLVVVSATYLRMNESNEDSFSAQERFLVYSIYLDFGFSMENVVSQGYGVFNDRVESILGEFRASHSIFLDWLVQFGIIGFVIMLYFFFYSFRRMKLFYGNYDLLTLSIFLPGMFLPISINLIFGFLIAWQCKTLGDEYD